MSKTIAPAADLASLLSDLHDSEINGEIYPDSEFAAAWRRLN